MILMMQNLGSKPKMTCNTITDVVMIMGLRYFFQSGLIATLCSATAGFGFFCIDCNAKYSCVTSFKTC